MLTAGEAEISIAHIISKDHDDIRRGFGGLRHRDRQKCQEDEKISHEEFSPKHAKV